MYCGVWSTTWYCSTGYLELTVCHTRVSSMIHLFRVLQCMHTGEGDKIKYEYVILYNLVNSCHCPIRFHQYDVNAHVTVLKSSRSTY
jgi:hypothetical protein